MKLFYLLVFSLFRLSVIAQINSDIATDVPDIGKIILSADHTWKKIYPKSSSNDTAIFKPSCDSALLTKYIDNRGEGQDYMLGARNVRTVLKGVAYRGGGNNKFNAISSRDNNNPLALESILRLSSMGFSDIIYLYSKDFSFYYSSDLLSKLRANGVNYQSIVPGDDSLARIIISMIYQRIKNPNEGPIYLHCWNGWHMSGLISAFLLMQFCDFSNNDALVYWMKGTDGNDKGYDKIKKRISSFTKSPEFSITPNEKFRICPCSK